MIAPDEVLVKGAEMPPVVELELEDGSVVRFRDVSQLARERRKFERDLAMAERKRRRKAQKVARHARRRGRRR